MDFPIHVFESIDSTNRSVLDAGAAGAQEGTTHLAHSQTRGRGRGSHTWWSPPGAGLWMSTLLRPRRERSRWGGLTLLAAVACRDALKRLGVPNVRVYWPNDLMVGRRKLGGILGEVRERGGRHWMALGVGINIDLTAPRTRAEMPTDIKRLAISLVEAGSPSTRDPVEIARHILEDFRDLYERFLRGESVREIAGPDAVQVGCEVELPAVGVRAVVTGISDGGHLVVRTETDQILHLAGGDVRYEPPPATG